MFAICRTIGLTLLVVGVAWCLTLGRNTDHAPYGLSVAPAFPGIVLTIVGLLVVQRRVIADLGVVLNAFRHQRTNHLV